MSSSTLDFIADHLPPVTADEVHRFESIVEIRDERAFAAELQAFLRERLAELEKGSQEQAMVRKAAILQAKSRWVPSATDIQRGRAAMLVTFNKPHNLPLAEFARLAGKSRQQIYKDIKAGRLLALSVGPRGQKLPDWQLEPVKQQLTEAVLQKALGLDTWTLYRALSEPLEGLEGLSPVEAVTRESIQDVLAAVLNVLGILD